MPYGQDAKLAIAFQNSRGTAASASSLYLIPFLSESLTPNYPELLSENMEGRFDEGEAYAGPRQVAGTIVSEAQPITIGVMLKAILGNPTTVNSDDIYTHTFKPRTGDFSPDEINNPMTAWKYLATNENFPVYQDLVAVRAEFSVANGEFLQAALDVLGGVVGTKADSDTNLGTAVGKKWTWDVTSFELGGAANTDLSALSVVIDEQSSPRWTLKTSKDPDRVKRDGRRQIRVNGTIKFEDQTEYDKFLAGSVQSFKATMTGPVEIQSGYYDVFQVIVPSFKYLAYPVNFADPSELQVTFEGKAEYHTGSATSIAIVLVNTQASF